MKRTLLRAVLGLWLCAAPCAGPAAAAEFELTYQRIDAVIAELALPAWFWRWPANIHSHAREPSAGGWPPALTEIYDRLRDLPGRAPQLAERQALDLGFDATRWRTIGNATPAASATSIEQCRQSAVDTIFIPYLAAVDAVVRDWGPASLGLDDPPAWAARLARGAELLADLSIGEAGLVSRGARIRRAAPAALAAIEDVVVRLRGLGCAFGGATIAIYETPFGEIVIGTNADDTYDSDIVGRAALIVDPGGNDSYALVPVGPGRQSTILDFAGDDSYFGSNLALGGFSAIVDFGGDDRYRGAVGAQAAAVGGLAFAADLGGDDGYEATSFSQAASLHGVAVLAGAAGRTSYAAADTSQAFAGPGGVSLLWDMGGENEFVVRGAVDPLGRGGMLGLSQGFAMGARGTLAGGVALLRAEGTDNRFTLGQFGQGAAYFGGVGVLDVGPGRATFVADRYAQGAGVHNAAGLLVSRGGPARFSLSVGVGQGLGLDQAIGVLLADGGPNEYHAPALAQGASTAGGIGLFGDGDPRSKFPSGTSDNAGLGVRRTVLTIGLGLRASASAPAPAAAKFEVAAATVTSEPVLDCPRSTTLDAAPGFAPAEALGRAAPLYGGSPEALAAYDAIVNLARGAPDAVPDLVADGDTGRALALREVLRCAFAGRTDPAARRLGEILRARLAADNMPNGDVFLGLALSLAARGDAEAAGEMEWRQIANSRSCQGRAVAFLELSRDPVLPDRPEILAAARRDPCWTVRLVGWERARGAFGGFDPDEVR